MNIIPFGPLLIQEKLTDSELAYIKEGFYKQEMVNIKTSLPDLSKRGRMDHNNKEYNEILKPYIEQYLNVMGWEGKYELTSLWGNVYENNDYVPPHIHIKCDLSFVLFLEMPPKEILNLKKREGMLCFMYGEQESCWAKVKPITLQEVLPREGEIYIFPQNLQHYTIPLLKENTKRVSISGNILLKSYD